MWFTSFPNAPIILANKRNKVIESIRLMLLMRIYDVVVPKRVSEEPIDHIFGIHRAQKKEL